MALPVVWRLYLILHCTATYTAPYTRLEPQALIGGPYMALVSGCDLQHYLTFPQLCREMSYFLMLGL